MDNFMDKLAERYNAGEMIKANSEAEAAQMHNLQEQVEAYEAVLQEMRKLNYKNTELTEKMYSLVDESIEKVRTLQIAASEGGASPELVSREMSDAVTGALNEALNNMDSTVARTISESLATALAQPTAEIKQSTAATENVGNKVDYLNIEMESVKNSSEQVFAGIEDIKASLAELAVKIDNIQTVNCLESAKEFTEEADTDNASVGNIELLNDLSSDVAKLHDMIALIQAGIDQNKGIMQTLSLGQEANREQMSSVTDNFNIMNQSLTDNKDLVNELGQSLVEARNEIVAAKTVAESVSMAVSANSEEMSVIKSDIQFVKHSLENNEQSYSQADFNEELKNTVLELVSSNDEIRNTVKLIKNSNDESKAYLKQSIDSSIYGLKMDNKDIVDGMRRISDSINMKKDDAEAERKEEESRLKEEENKKALEERFKMSEDFMHRESVKVYRNVQAVINEKNDQQTFGLESKIKTNSSQIGQVKVIAIVAACLSGLSLVAQVLSVFGIL